MYGLLITFETTTPLADLEAPFTEFAHALTEVPGLLTKTWIHDGDTLGGFHLFETQEHADTYMGSDLAAGLKATDGFDNFAVRGFDVLTDLSALTGIGAPVAA